MVYITKEKVKLDQAGYNDLQSLADMLMLAKAMKKAALKPDQFLGTKKTICTNLPCTMYHLKEILKMELEHKLRIG